MHHGGEGKANPGGGGPKVCATQRAVARHIICPHMANGGGDAPLHHREREVEALGGSATPKVWMVAMLSPGTRLAA